MKNQLHNALQILFTAAATLVSGQTFRIGSSVGVVGDSLVSGDEGILHLSGVFELTKNAPEVWNQGQKVYWDNGNAEWTTTVGTNDDVGAVAWAAVASAALLGYVLLPGVSAR